MVIQSITGQPKSTQTSSTGVVQPLTKTSTNNPGYVAPITKAPSPTPSPTLQQNLMTFGNNAIKGVENLFKPAPAPKPITLPNGKLVSTVTSTQAPPSASMNFKPMNGKPGIIEKAANAVINGTTQTATDIKNWFIEANSGKDRKDYSPSAQRGEDLIGGAVSGGLVSTAATDIGSVVKSIAFKATQDVTENPGVMQKFFISSKDLLSGDSKTLNDIIKSLNLSPSEVKALRKGGLNGAGASVEVPPSTIVSIADKPWFSSLKSKIGVEPASPSQFVIQAKPNVTNVTALLGDGEHQPQAVIDTIINNGATKTPEGKILMKTAIQAKATGQSVQIGEVANTGKRIGMMDNHPSYTPHMNALISEAQKNGDLFPYSKMTSAEQKILDNAFKETLSNIPIKESNSTQSINPNIKPSLTETNNIQSTTNNEYNLSYPTTLKPSEIEKFATNQGSYAREVSQRLEAGKISQGDLARAGIKIKRTDLKLMLQSSSEMANKPLLTFQDGKFVFNGKSMKMKIEPSALGVDPEQFKNGDILNIEAVLKDKGLAPRVELTNTFKTLKATKTEQDAVLNPIIDEISAIINAYDSQGNKTSPSIDTTENSQEYSAALSSSEGNQASSSNRPEISGTTSTEAIGGGNTRNVSNEPATAITSTSGNGQKLEYTPSQNLNPEEAQIETNFGKQLSSNLNKSISDYKAKFGNELNTDNARELSPDYAKDKNSRSSLSKAVHEPASALIKEIYKRELAIPSTNNKILFTAGGTGAGKTSAINSIKELSNIKKEAQLVYDTNLNTPNSAIQKIDQALKAGKNVGILYVHRTPLESLVKGSLPRAMRMGRTVPLEEHIKTHLGAVDTILQLAEKYKDNPNVVIRIVDNTKGKGQATISTLDLIKQLSYNKDELKQELNTALSNEYENKSITKEVYEGTKANSQGVGGQNSTNGSGEHPQQLKTSKIGTSIEQKAVDANLTSKFSQTAGYTPIVLKEQAKIATDLINNNINEARSIIRGEQPLPSDLKGTALITAMEEHLKINPSADLAYELANSPLVSGTSTSAQELRLAAEREPDSVTAALQKVRAAREKAFNKAHNGKSVTEVTKDQVKKGQQLVNKQNKYDWNAFISEIIC